MSTTITLMELERHNNLEKERNETMVSEEFIRWMYEFSVGTIAEDNSTKINANQLMNQYDRYAKFIKKINL